MSERVRGNTTVVACSERPRFYIYESKDVLARDADTPAAAGATACFWASTKLTAPCRDGAFMASRS